MHRHLPVATSPFGRTIHASSGNGSASSAAYTPAAACVPGVPMYL